MALVTTKWCLQHSTNTYKNITKGIVIYNIVPRLLSYIHLFRLKLNSNWQKNVFGEIVCEFIFDRGNQVLIISLKTFYYHLPLRLKVEHKFFCILKV